MLKCHPFFFSFIKEPMKKTKSVSWRAQNSNHRHGLLFFLFSFMKDAQEKKNNFFQQSPVAFFFSSTTERAGTSNFQVVFPVTCYRLMLCWLQDTEKKTTRRYETASFLLFNFIIYYYCFVFFNTVQWRLSLVLLNASSGFTRNMAKNELSVVKNEVN